MLFQRRVLLLSLLITVNAQQPPALNVTLTPNFRGEKATTLGVRLVLENPDIGANQSLAQMSLDFASIPTQQYSSDAIDAYDAGGRLPLTHAEGVSQEDGDMRYYFATRATIGDVVLEFTAEPNGALGGGPVVDFRTEQDGLGLNGAGELTRAPAGTRGIWSFAEGTVTKIGPPTLLTESYYAVGQVNSYPEPGARSNYSMYWFGEPPFNITQAAIWTGELFKNMQQFFRDNDDTYRVFARKTLEVGVGGTALTRSFMYYYGDNDTRADLENLLAHEMVHNWPRMTGTDAEITWYAEGIADYYSARLPYRFGMHTVDQFAKEMNGFARAYYANPFINITNEEQAKWAFESRAMQTLPYGRGNMFLIQLNTEIRAKSNGTRSLDNVVQLLLDRSRTAGGDTLDDLLNILVQELGSEVRKEYKDMANGKLLVPPENSLGPCFLVEKTSVPITQKNTTYEPNPSGQQAPVSNSSAIAVAYTWRKKLGMDGKECMV